MQDKLILLNRNFTAVAYNGVENDNDLNEAIKSHEKPLFEFTQTIASLLPNENCIKLKFDFPGNVDYYGFYLTLFLYNDHKVLGTWHYLREANWADEKIFGQFKLSENTLRLFTKVDVLNSETESYCILITNSC